ncbi:hypothetical protein [Chromobacterium sinusclupearum]|uniref:hypothetical protein n=1 Tax=Chromobacterium sinusclupearum TaxID=2077146 RepID=UPI0011AEFD42|nr:hypothetical protein [Chromobacterium sinusclupearum]
MPQRRLTEEQTKCIRTELLAAGADKIAVAEKWGISISTVNRIIAGISPYSYQARATESLVLNMSGPAYQKREIRAGPPLDYVSEKLERALTSLHYQILTANRNETPHELFTPFYHSINAFVALHCMLDDWGKDFRGLVEQLIEMDAKQFADWVELVASTGSVTGHAQQGKEPSEDSSF